MQNQILHLVRLSEIRLFADFRSKMRIMNKMQNLNALILQYENV